VRVDLQHGAPEQGTGLGCRREAAAVLELVLAETEESLVGEV
jgi:hypothetical protein